MFSRQGVLNVSSTYDGFMLPCPKSRSIVYSIINKYRANDKFFCMYVCMYVCIEKILLYKTHWMTPIFLKVVIKARRIKHHFKIHVPSQFFILITITKY
ncbi:putative uncharacterized protein PRO1854 [Macaca fascicularis]|uniref:putative uncharacterized protein PRO1854 n=1 Tax=Macaca fascicularis TaxID=9541 RepID=UPI003D159942